MGVFFCLAPQTGMLLHNKTLSLSGIEMRPCTETDFYRVALFSCVHNARKVTQTMIDFQSAFKRVYSWLTCDILLSTDPMAAAGSVWLVFVAAACAVVSTKY